MHDGLVSFHASVTLLQLVQATYPNRSIYQDQVELVRPCFREQGEFSVKLSVKFPVKLSVKLSVESSYK